MKVDFAGGGVEAEEAAASEEEAPAPAVYGCQHRSGVAGQLIAQLVLDLAGPFVEGDDGAAVALGSHEISGIAAFWAAADLANQQVAFDDGRAADAEEILDDIEFCLRIKLPNKL